MLIIPLLASASLGLSGKVSSDNTGPLIVFEEVDTDLDLVEYIGQRAVSYGLDPEMAKAVAYCESNYIPTAQNPTSSAGGIYQFLNGTWEYVNVKRGVDYSLEDKYDPIKSIENAMWLAKHEGWTHWECYTKYLV